MNEISLDSLPINKESKVIRLECTGNIRRRMLDLGIVKNTFIKPILKSPSGDPTAYEVRGSIIALRTEDAKLIFVKEV